MGKQLSSNEREDFYSEKLFSTPVFIIVLVRFLQRSRCIE